jgi:hypothetical protein
MITLGYGKVNQMVKRVRIHQAVYFKDHEKILIVPWEDLRDTRCSAILPRHVDSELVDN